MCLCCEPQEGRRRNSCAQVLCTRQGYAGEATKYCHALHGACDINGKVPLCRERRFLEEGPSAPATRCFAKKNGAWQHVRPNMNTKTEAQLNLRR